MNNDVIESEENLEEMLATLRYFIETNPKGFLLQLSRFGEDPTDPFTTTNTLLALDYDEKDVISVVLGLSKQDYVKTVEDRKREHSPPFWIFEKLIQERSVYIKIKLRKEKNVFCMSFHFAKYPIGDKPYA